MNEIEHLINQWLNSEITPEGHAELNRLLRESDEALECFVHDVDLHYRLREVYVAEGESVFSLDRDVLSDKVLNDFSETPQASTHRQRSAIWSTALLASALMIVLVAVSFSQRKQETPNAHGPEKITRTEMSGFQEPQRDALIKNKVASQPALSIPGEPAEVAIVESSTDASPDAIPAKTILRKNDRYHLASGTARLRLYRGVDLEISAPAVLQFHSPLKVTLYSGQVTASVEESARGFTIVTPTADVIDLGTRFGLNVTREGHSDVVVFEGTVDVKYEQGRNSGRNLLHRLTKGEALRIMQFGAVVPLVTVRRDVHDVGWATEIHDSNVVIARITDNYIGPDQPVYYGLVPGGFNEDAVAYVDRPYEWNSLPGIPFPESLRGGDYIQTFNNLKLAMNFQMKIQLRRTADIYILMDERVPIPEWLRQGFEKTDYRIGMDECRPPRWQSRAVKGLAKDQRGSGPGQSVDYAFSVWKKRATADDFIVLGALYDSVPEWVDSGDGAAASQPCSMYGIVVVSVDGE